MIPPFRIRNCHSHPIRLIIEPVATDYTLLPDEMVELAVDTQPQTPTCISTIKSGTL